MKRHGAVLAAMVATLGLVACQTIVSGTEVGSGTSRTEERSAGTFTEIRVAAAIEATVTIGSPASIRVTADDNLLDNVKTSISGGRLDIAMQGSVTARTRVSVAVVTPSLEAIEANSSAVARVSGIDVSMLRVQADSAGVVDADGRAQAIDVKGTSAGRVDLDGLEADTATVSLDSAAHASLRVADEVHGTVSSAAVLALSGDTSTVDVATSSAGQVTRQ